MMTLYSDMRGHMKEMRRAHFRGLWAPFSVIMLGAWLAAFPFAAGGFDGGPFSARIMQVTAARHLADPAWRYGGWKS